MQSTLLEDFLKKICGDEHTSAVEAFQVSYALLRVMFDQSTSLMGLLKPDGTVLDINSTANSFITVKESEVIGALFWETPWWTHSSEQQMKVRNAVEAAARGEFVRFETYHLTNKGAIFYVDFSLKPVRDDKGNVVLLFPEGREITERKLAEEAQRATAVKYRIVADNTYNMEFWLTPDDTFVYISPSCMRLCGHDAEDFYADPALLLRIIHPDDRQLWASHRHDINLNRELGEAEFRIIHADGGIRWVQHVCLPVFDDNGVHLGTRGSFTDITKRRLAEEKNLRLAGIVEASDDAIIGKTVDGIITSWNRGAAAIFGYSEDEVLGRPVTILVPDDCKERIIKVHERVRNGEHVEHFESMSRRKDGELIQMSLTYSPVRDELGRITAISTIGRDITEQKRAARALLDNARITRELEIAKEIQQSFLPLCPAELPGVLMTCRCLPAAHVGGDYYDFFPLENGMVDAVIADVTGHSVGSSLLMTMARSVLHAKVGSGRSPGALLATVNDLLFNDLSHADLQLSMFYVRLDPNSRTLSYANAGHNRPLLFRCQERKIMELDADGLLMGIKTAVFFEEKTVRVDPGDILILCTDGITEAENDAGELFGAGRLGRIIAAHHQLHPQKIMAAIFQAAETFTLADDVAMIIFKML